MQPALIEFEHVSIMRGDTLALDDLTLTIAQGEHVAILGPNGCGKSTLIKAINRECYPVVQRDGVLVPHSLRILGRDRWNVIELRQMMGIVSSDLMTACSQDSTGFDIALSGFFSSIGIWPHHEVTDQMRHRAHEALRLMEVDHLADRWTDEMSSGEARRVLIARALVHQPRALLLDEPSTALDLFAQHELREVLRKLAKSGITIVMVTHHLSDLIPEMERVILMQSGRVVADGRTHQTLTSERLSTLFGLPLELMERDGYYNLW